MHLARRKNFGQALIFIVVACLFIEIRPRDPGAPMSSVDPAVRIFTNQVIDKEILQRHDLAFDADHFGDVGDLARAVAHARGLNNDVNRGGDHFPDGLAWEIVAAHQDHAFQAAQTLARRIGVERSHGAVVAGVHGLEQVEGFRAAHLADDDPVRAHAQAVLDGVAHGHLALTFEVRRARLQAHHMGLLQLQLRGVLAGDDALVRLDIDGQAVEQGRLPRAGAAGNQHVAAHSADDREQRTPFGADGPYPDELVEREAVPPDCEW